MKRFPARLAAALLLAALTTARANSAPPISIAHDAAYEATLVVHPNACVIPDGVGGNYAAWLNGPAGGINLQRIDGEGRVAPGWTAGGRTVAAANTFLWTPCLASDGRGGVLLGASEGYGSYVLRLAPNGSQALGWPADGLGIWRPGFLDAAVAVAPDGDGGLFFTLRRQQAYTDTLSRIVVGHLDARGAPTAWWSPSGNEFTQSAVRFAFPEIHADGAGGVFVAYEAVGADGRTHAGVMRAIAGSMPAPGWPAAGVVADTSGTASTFSSSEDHPVLADDGEGGVFLAWTHLAEPTYWDLDVHVQHVRASGDVDPAWPADGVRVCPSSGQEAAPRLAPDAHGGVYVMMRLMGYGLALQHVARDGSVGGGAWPADGIRPGPYDYTSSDRALAPDGLGGAIVTWLDMPKDPNPIVQGTHLLHVDESGLPLAGSTGDGIPIALVDTTGFGLNVAGDGHGGMLALWSVHRADGTTDVVGARAPGTDAFAAALRLPRLTLLSLGPNPTRDASTVEFALPRPVPLVAEVHDVSGRRVRLLESGPRGPGIERLTWDGRDDDGRPVRSGVYLLTARAGDTRATARIAVVH